jgi:hypothetical protein
LKIELRPADFWTLTPVELTDMVTAYYERFKADRKEAWRRAAFVASWIINSAGKTFRGDVSAEKLVQFKDEVQSENVKPIDPEERRRQADESFMMHKARAWMLLRSDEAGKVKVFDEEHLNKLKERLRKNRN